MKGRKKARTAAPPIAPKERRKAAASRRESLIKVLATEDERDAFQAAADRMGLSLSAWMRAVAIAMSKAPGSTTSIKAGEG